MGTSQRGTGDRRGIAGDDEPSALAPLFGYRRRRRTRVLRVIKKKKKRLLIGKSIYFLLTALFAAFVLRAHGSGVDATTIAPVLDRAPVASDAIPQDTLAAEQRFGEALDASTSRRIAFGALSEWIVQSSSAISAPYLRYRPIPGSVRWGCSKALADNSAFVSLSVTPLTSPAATTWRGVISGLAAANVSSIEVIHVDGTISTLVRTQIMGSSSTRRARAFRAHLRRLRRSIPKAGLPRNDRLLGLADAVVGEVSRRGRREVAPGHFRELQRHPFFTSSSWRNWLGQGGRDERLAERGVSTSPVEVGRVSTQQA